MAAADYRLCDVCDGKAFYDASLNYEHGRDNEWAKSKTPFRWAGEEQGKPESDDWLLRLDYLGDWAVICSACAKTHKTIVVPIEKERIVAGAFPGGNPAAKAMIAQTPQAEPKREPVGTLTIRDDMGAEITFHRSFTMRPSQTFAIYPNWDLLTHDIPTRGAFVVNAPKEIGNEFLPFHPAPAAPDGWKLVPVEPTQAMNNAGLSAVNQHGKRLVWETYKAMLAAAPAAPQAEQPIDLDAVAMQQMRQAAAESTWMPSEYTSNDWIADVCRWLRDGPPQAEPKRDQSMLDLLAVIHCDGGHHTEAVGIEQSIKDALSAVCVLKGKLAQAEPKREPLPGLAPTHRCPACGALWRQCDDASWNLRSALCCGLCDAGRVELVRLLDEPQREPSLGELMREQRQSRIVAGAYPDGNPNAGAMMAQTRQAEPKRGLTCLWSRADDDTDMWETSCGHAFTIIDGTPSDNHMGFCCYCGRRVDEEIGGSDE